MTRQEELFDQIALAALESAKTLTGKPESDVETQTAAYKLASAVIAKIIAEVNND